MKEPKKPEDSNLLSDLEPCMTCPEGQDAANAANRKEAQKAAFAQTEQPEAEAGQTAVLETAKAEPDPAAERQPERPQSVGGVAESLMAELQASKQAAKEAAERIEVSAENEKELEAMGGSEAQPKKSRKGWIIGISAACLTVAAAVVLAVLFISTGLSQSEKDDLYQNGTYIEGVSIYQVPVGGKTIAQARELVNQAMMANEDKAVLTIQVKDREIPITTKDIESDTTLEAVLREAMLYGREGSMVAKNKTVKETAENGKNFTIGLSGNEETIKALSQRIAEKHNIPMVEADVTINPEGAVGEKFLYTQEVVGIEIDQLDLQNQLKAYANAPEQSAPMVVAYREVQPSTSLETLKQNMVQRSKFSTNVGGVWGRKKNVAKAGQIMNGTKVMPGETYDLEGALGPRNRANGWNLAAEIVDNEFVDGYGGGICQASTTLFNAAVRADLEIVERKNHSLRVSYVKVGFDAAISSGGPKMIFRNTTPYPIFIFASSNDSLSELTVEIYGAPFPFGEPKYEEGSSASGGSYHSTLKILDQSGNVHSTKSWSSRYGTPKPKTTASTKKPADTGGTAAPTPSTPTPAPSEPTPPPTDSETPTQIGG